MGGLCVWLPVSLLLPSCFPTGALLWLASLSAIQPHMLLILRGYKEYSTLQTCLDNRNKRVAHLIKSSLRKAEEH